MNKLFIFGLGYVGQSLASFLQSQGWQVAGSTRTLEKQTYLQAQNLKAILYDGRSPIPEEILSQYDSFLVTISPEDQGCQAFLHHAHLLKKWPPRWVGYCSSTSVYGDHQGAWVTETSETKATFPAGLQRLKAEAQWAQLSAIAPVILFRLSGIYGPGRSILEQVKEGKAQRIIKTGHVFSRIHVEDICQAITATLVPQAAGVMIYNLADDCPAPSSELIEYACDLLGVSLPAEIPFAQAQLSPIARHFYLDHKKVSNQKMRDMLKVTLRYPTYKEGLKNLLLRHSGRL